MRPRQQRINIKRRRGVPDSSDVFVRKRRVDEGIVPGIMSLDPITDHGREFSGLKTYPWMIERRVAQKIFIQAHVRAVIGRIETMIGSKLAKEIPVTSPLRVEKDRQSRVKEKVIVGED
jgi:hypothetical protein